MKRILLTTIALFFAGFFKTFAQQEPQFTHYMFDKLVYNPAAAGVDREYINITGLYHDQWMSFHAPEGESAPITQNASIDGSIHPASLAARNQYIGLGFHFLNDREGFIGSTGFLLSAAYHFSPSFGGDLSAGLNVGMINKTIDPKWNAGFMNDPLLPGQTSAYGLDGGLGIYYSTIKYYVGISALHIPESQLKWAVPYNIGVGSGADYYVDRTYFLTAGYFYDLPNPDLQLQPSVLVKFDQATTSGALTALMYYKQKFWGGLNYRTENVTALSVMAGLYLTSNLKIGASYDIATSSPQAFGGTMEFFFSYRFKINIPVEPPTWDKGVRFL